MKSGGTAASNAELWMEAAGEHKRRAETLALELMEVTRERDELQESLDHIAEIAAPERVIDSERLEKLTRMVEMLMDRAGFAPGDYDPMPEPEKDPQPDGSVSD
jgi:hypothetical protein